VPLWPDQAPFFPYLTGYVAFVSPTRGNSGLGVRPAERPQILAGVLHIRLAVVQTVSGSGPNLAEAREGRSFEVRKTASEEAIYLRWCCIDLLNSHGLIGR